MGSKVTAVGSHLRASHHKHECIYIHFHHAADADVNIMEIALSWHQPLSIAPEGLI
jgi:hypothetical protein